MGRDILINFSEIKRHKQTINVAAVAVFFPCSCSSFSTKYRIYDVSRRHNTDDGKEDVQRYYDGNNSNSNLAKRNRNNMRNEWYARFWCWICRKYKYKYVDAWMVAGTTYIYKVLYFRVHHIKAKMISQHPRRKIPNEKKESERRSSKKKITIVNYKWCLFCVASYSFDINLWGKCFRLMQSIFRV